MKILRITAQGLPLFKEDLDICFYTQQRVSEDDKNNLYNLIDKKTKHEHIYLLCKVPEFLSLERSVLSL